VNDYPAIHPQAVGTLLGELLAALGAGGADRAVLALRRLTTGPAPAESDLVAVTEILRAAGRRPPAAAAPEADPAAGPFAGRPQAEEVFAHVRRGAESGTFGTATEFLTAYLADSIDSFGAEVGPYDRALITRIAGLFDAIDVAVIASWLYRVTHDRPAGQ
jgi:hypothetical protein